LLTLDGGPQAVLSENRSWVMVSMSSNYNFGAFENSATLGCERQKQNTDENSLGAGSEHTEEL